MKTEAPRPVRLEEYRPPAYLVDDVRLDVSLHPTRTRVKSRLKLRPNPASAESGGPLRLDGEHLELAALRLDRKPLDPKAYQLTETGLTIPRPPAKPFTLEATTYVNPDANKALQGLYRSRGVYCTQCEAEGFRRITYFPDRPDVLARYEVRIEADAGEAPVLLSNGNPVEQGQLARGRHYAVWRDPFPKPCYLFALGRRRSRRRCRHVHDGLGPRGRAEHLRRARQGGAGALGARCACSAPCAGTSGASGASTTSTCSTSSPCPTSTWGRWRTRASTSSTTSLVLASPETATDAIFEHIEAVVAHEYFHNWTGNRITCRDWFQLCLKEGLTVFRDQEFSADERSATVQRIADVRQLRTQQFAEDAGPLAHPVRPESYIEINNFYTATVYEKGAEVVRMIQTLLGPALSARAWISTSSATTARPRPSRTSWRASPRCPGATSRSSSSGTARRARRSSSARWRTTRPRRPPSCAWSRCCRTPGGTRQEADAHPLRLGLLGANGQDIR